MSSSGIFSSTMLRGIRKRFKLKRGVGVDIETRPKENEQKEPTHNRSANNFATAEELKQALVSCDAKGTYCIGGDQTAWLFSKNQRILQELIKTEGKPEEVLGQLDWVLKNYDESTSEMQTIEKELRRLLVLKSFLVLDSSQKESFDEITAMAQQTFRTNYCMISLVDLGRQWFLSKQGLDATETPRSISFCTHGIQSVLDVFEVPDASQDERFKDNPLVTGPPYVQYYAGAPLISPEGYKIGMLCVCDMHPRDPMALEQREHLKSMAAMTVHTLVEHRRKMSAWFNNLVRTHFPALEIEDDDDDAERAKTNDNMDSQEEDEEFAGFIEATSKLRLDSLFDMLRKEATEANHKFKPQKRVLEPALLPDVASRPSKKVHKHKQVHFSKDARCRYVESWKGIKDLWNSPEEMHDIKNEYRDSVRCFRTRHDYKRAIIKAMDISKQSVKDHYLEFVTAKVPSGRGLEGSVIDIMRDNRKAARKAIVQEQWLIQGGYRKDDGAERLRNVSVENSELSTRLAVNLAQVDLIGTLTPPAA